MRELIRQVGADSIKRGRSFLAEFVRDPRTVGSVVPSSNKLAEMMVDGLPRRLPGTIVELGPGTGSFTSLVAERLALDARYVGVELNANFHELLEDRFAAHDRMRFARGSAELLGDHLREAGVSRADTVISGLPLILMSRPAIRQIVDQVADVLQPGGMFRTFSYVHSYNMRNTVFLREVLKERFDSFSIETPVWQNFPPALVYTATLDSEPDDFASLPKYGTLR